MLPPNIGLKLVFTKTRILSVKVATLNTFLVMVKTLDQVIAKSTNDTRQLLI